MRIYLKSIIITLCAVLLLLLYVSISCAAVKYEYTGKHTDNYVSGLFSATDYVSAYFIIDQPPTTGAYHAVDFLDYGASIGPLTLTKAEGADSGASLTFDPQGNITSWSFVVGNYLTPLHDPSLIEAWLNSPDLPPGMERITVNYQDRQQLGWTSDPGEWTWHGIPIPEPSTAFLVTSGMLMFCLVAKRKK